MCYWHLYYWGTTVLKGLLLGTGLMRFSIQSCGWCQEPGFANQVCPSSDVCEGFGVGVGEILPVVYWYVQLWSPCL